MRSTSIPLPTAVRQALLGLCALAATASLLFTAPATLAQSSSARESPTASALPSLGDGDGMSIGAERRLGDRIARDIYRDPDYIDDPVLGDYLQALWQPLLGAARDRGDVPPELAERMAWELVVSRDKRVNAFALPGGYLGVNLGLVALTDRPEEVASVMAHELSHVSQRHIARMMSRQDRMAPWMMGAMILGALAAGSNANVAGAAIAGSSAVAAQSQLNFSRDMEREADRVGFGVLTEAGFDGNGFVSMFDKMQQASRYDDGSFPYLRSHPLTGDRIADMRSRLPQGGQAASSGGPTVAAAAAAASRSSGAMAGGGSGLRLELPGAGGGRGARDAAVSLPMPSRAVHALMAARARVLAENSPDRQRAWLASGQAANASHGDRYAAALSALRLGQRDLALDVAQRLRTAVTADARPTVDALLMDVLLAPGAATPLASPQAQLLAELRDQALAGTSRASVLLGAQAALATGQPQRAVSRLQAWVAVAPRDAVAWQTLSRAYGVQGQQLRSIRAEAEAHAAHLDFGGAVDRFKVAQALPAAQRTDAMELAIVDSRRREVEAQLRDSVSEEK